MATSPPSSSSLHEPATPPPRHTSHPDAQPNAMSDLNIKDCETEPIRTPGSIQPHGFLVVLDPDSYTITQLSDNVHLMTDKTATQLLGQHLDALLGQQQAEYVIESLQSIGTGTSSVIDINPLAVHFHFSHPMSNVNVPGAAPPSPQLKKSYDEQTIADAASNGRSNTNDDKDYMLTFDLTFFSQPDKSYVLEFEPSIQRQRNYADVFYRSSMRSIDKVRSAISDLQILLSTTAQEIRRLTCMDRVMVYQFDPVSLDGEIVAENKAPELESFLGLHYPASDIPKQAREMYVKNKFRIICDVDYKPAQLLRLPTKTDTADPSTPSPIDLSAAVLRAVSPIHLQYLKNMDVRASLSISIVVDDQLWGLVICHHATPHFVSYEMRRVCESLSHLVSLLVVNCTATARRREYDKRREHMRATQEVLGKDTSWWHDLIEHSERVLPIVNATGMACYVHGELYHAGAVPPEDLIEQVVAYVRPQLANNRVFVTDNLPRLIPAAVSQKNVASGCMAVRVNQDPNCILLFFRQEILSAVKWAGNPNLKKMSQTFNGVTYLTPRNSFQQWIQQVECHSTEWSAVDIELMSELTRYLVEVQLHYSTVRAEVESREKARLAEQLNRQQGLFIDKMCHEIRNPVNGIMGTILMMKEQLEAFEQSLSLNPSQQSHTNTLNALKQHLSNIGECAEHQRIIANDVLSLSTLERQMIKLSMRPLSLSRLLRDTMEMFAGRAKEKKLTLDISLFDGMPVHIIGDAVRIRQIISNCLENALKFTSTGFVGLHASLDATIGEIRLDFTDSGIGMSQEEVEQLFQPYSQANFSINSSYGGTGLGLSICHELAKLMNGKLTVDSSRGIGSTFSFTFVPQIITAEEYEKYEKTQKAVPDAKVSPTSSSAAAGSAKVSKRVLIVEDNIINQKVLSNIIAKAGYECALSSNGQDGYDQYIAGRHNILFIDIEMPIKNGLQCTEEIRQYERDHRLTPAYIICLSGNARDEYKQKAFAAGVNAYLVKPFRRTEVLQLCSVMPQSYTSELY